MTQIIAKEPGESGVAFVQGGGEEQDAVLVDQGGALVEEALDLVLRRRRPSTRPTESPVVYRTDSRFSVDLPSAEMLNWDKDDKDRWLP